MSIYKRGDVYWYKFMFGGKLVRESTKQGNDKVARQMEAAHRTSLAKGEVGIREKKAVPTLAEFLRKEFVPYVEAKHKAKPGTAEYYRDGANLVLKCDWATDKLDQISDQHAQQFAAKLSHLSPSRINCGLRSLRRALNLAFEWGKLDRPAKITIAKGERQRDRVLTDAEWQQYITECPQPWRDAAMMIRGTGMRPGEVFTMRWENIYLNGTGGLIQVTDGKTKAARRMLPMVPAVYAALKARHEAAGYPHEGWLFPSGSREGHFNKDTAKGQHAKAIELANIKARQNGGRTLKPFEPYVLRHTALTQLAQAGADVFTLARIAGHSSITITQRYVHPQADAIERAFAHFGAAPSTNLNSEGTAENSQVGTNLGTVELCPKREPLQLVGAKGGTRTPTVLPARS
jgi:integrase